MAASLRRPAARTGVRFALDVEPAWVRGDPALLERLVANLLENVIRHGADGAPARPATIRVRDGAAALVEVANGGAIIAPAALARLGDPFQRWIAAARTAAPGLGLSIVRAVAEAHGGGLELRAPAARLPTWCVEWCTRSDTYSPHPLSRAAGLKQPS